MPTACSHQFDLSSHKKFWSYLQKLQNNHSNITTLCLQDKILTSSIDKANALNICFTQIYHQTNFLKQQFTSNSIKYILENLDPSKSARPNNIPTHIFLNYVLLKFPCTSNYNFSITSGRTTA